MMPPMELPIAMPIFVYLFRGLVGDGIDVVGEIGGGVVVADVEAEGEDLVTVILVC